MVMTSAFVLSLPVLNRVAASLNVRAASSGVESGLRELKWSFLSLDGHLDHLDVLLHV
jgi:hypothetical protein